MGTYITKHINRLILDPNNYRFIDSKDYVFVEEANISAERVQLRTKNLLVGKNEENIFDLLGSFKANGVLPLDPIQVREMADRNFLVIEGNRRTATLKSLYEDFKSGKDVGKLTDSDFRSVEVVQISEENPVQHLITMGLHHISGKKKWSPVNQAQLVYDLKNIHQLPEEDICSSLAITKHGLRRSLRVLSLIERYKKSDYGDQFQSNMYSVFEEVIKKTEMKTWLGWNDDNYTSANKINEEKLFSWISREEDSNRNDDNDEEHPFIKEPIITKSHEIRELSNFINDPKALEQMEKSRSISAGYGFSDVVGEARLRNAMENIGKEVTVAFQFSEHLLEDDYSKIRKMMDKLDRLIPTSKAFVSLSQKDSNIFFNAPTSHFEFIKVQKYRKLVNVDIKHLTRVNIFAGSNNSGKTSILELVFLMTRLNSLSSLIELEKYRGRFMEDMPAKWLDKIFVDDIQIEGNFNNTHCAVHISKTEAEDIDKGNYISSIQSEANVNGESLSSVIHLFSDKEASLYFQKSKFLCEATFSSPYRYNGNLLKKAHAKAVQERYFDEIIQFIKDNMDSNIERIDMVEIENESRFMVSVEGLDHAVDITKFGEGLQRVFEITLLMGYSRNGVICIDELDSAIHKSLLKKLTQFIQASAEKFNVQVFLSTHSKECIDAFVENDYPDDNLTAYALNEEDGKVICRFLAGNKLKLLVESTNIDIR